jgi:hypothetical protein
MSATWRCERCAEDHLGNCPQTGTAETWNDHQLLEAVADYLADGKLRPLLDLGFEDKREIGAGLRIVSARIRELEVMRKHSKLSPPVGTE